MKTTNQKRTAQNHLIIKRLSKELWQDPDFLRAKYKISKGTEADAALLTFLDTLKS